MRDSLYKRNPALKRTCPHHDWRGFGKCPYCETKEQLTKDNKPDPNNIDCTDFPTKGCRNCGRKDRPQWRGHCNDDSCSQFGSEPNKVQAFLAALPESEEEFVKLLMDNYIIYCERANCQRPSAGRFEVERLSYSSLYRQLVGIRNFQR